MVTEKLYKWGSLVATLLNLLTKMHKKKSQEALFLGQDMSLLTAK